VAGCRLSYYHDLYAFEFLLFSAQRRHGIGRVFVVMYANVMHQQ
jgi:hypothetical protein